jgi:hypothetical protein
VECPRVRPEVDGWWGQKSLGTLKGLKAPSPGLRPTSPRGGEERERSGNEKGRWGSALFYWMDELVYSAAMAMWGPEAASASVPNFSKFFWNSATSLAACAS